MTTSSTNLIAADSILRNESVYSFFQLMTKSLLQFTAVSAPNPLVGAPIFLESMLGMNVSSPSIKFALPNMLLWFAGYHTSVTLYKYFKCAKNYMMTWFYSMFNASKYLSPVPNP